MTEPVLVQGKPAIDQVLRKGQRVVLPIFDTPHATSLLPVAGKVKSVLAGQGVEVEIRRNPAQSTYWLSYDPTPEQQQENTRADTGATIGRIQRQTVNRNDWYSALSDYRFGLPVILLDLAQVADNPMAEALDGEKGILWPQVSPTFPGPGRGVVQGIHWAFAPRVCAVVIRAADVDGLMAAAASLAALPADQLTPGIQSAKAQLWREYHVGGTPPTIDPDLPLSSSGRKVTHAPQAFAMRFADATPPPADAVIPPAPPARTAVALPGEFGPKQFIPQLQDGQQYIEAGTAKMLIPDLRFSQGILLLANVPQAGRMVISAEGSFRYSDRRPCWQAQWEDILDLRDKLVPKERRPMEIEVRLGQRIVGKLIPAQTEQRQVPLEMASPSAGLKPRTAIEEVVTRLSGEIDLPAGRQEILLIHRNMVDGKLDRVTVALPPAKQ